MIESKLKEDNSWRDYTNLDIKQFMELLKLVINNSFFMFENVHYQQLFGCAMGSPIIAVIAELVMQYIENKALRIFPNKPRCRYRYVDDTNSCLRDEEMSKHSTHI